GERSPLSVWSDRPIVKHIRFTLSIDGPHRQENERVSLQGNCSQLTHLYEQVNAYIQQTLKLSSSQFQTTILQSPTSSVPATAPAKAISPAVEPESSLAPSTPSGQALAPPGWLRDMGWSSSQSTSSSTHSPATSSATSSKLARRSLGAATKGTLDSSLPPTVQLLPKGLLKHEMYLGPLAKATKQPSITLSTTELFDLANALDSFHAEVDHIPELNPQQSRHFPAPWLKIAAIAIFTVGTTASLIRFSQRTETEASFETALSEQQVSSQPTTPRLSERLGDSVDFDITAIPPATEALPELFPEADGSGAIADGELDEADSIDAPFAGDVSSDSDPDAREASPNADANLADAAANSETALVPASPTPQSPAPFGNAPVRPGTTNPSAPGNPSLGAPLEPSSSPGATSSPSADAPADVAALDPNEIPLQLAEIPPILPGSSDDLSLDRRLENDALGASEFPSDELSVARRQPNVAPLQNSLQSESEGATTYSPGAQNTSELSSSAPATAPQNQLAEVQTYFENQWQPPANLKQPLQFRLLFNADGSLQQAIPLGESARSSRSIVNLPAPGEPFVSSFGGNDTPPMRLFLGTNGQVRVFLETLD
ncbi:MAG: DUF4335 domain-containing protein, partial [Merismopedia sp. SIO2A8]|nr:DUF4335 domain-containing protein [Merismopedia sp. SIO2A8]